jgi:hypothetical protein
MYLDEVYLSNHALSLGAAAEVLFDMTLKGSLLSIGDVVLFNDVRVTDRSTFSTKGYSPIYGTVTGAYVTDSLTDISLGMLYSRIDVSMGLRGIDSAFTVTPSHRIEIPEIPGPLKFTDVYRITPTDSGINFLRENSLVVTPDKSGFTGNLFTQAYSIGSILIQNWAVSLSYLIEKILNLQTAVQYMESRDHFIYNYDWYLSSWLSSYSYVLPYQDGSSIEQKGSFGFIGNVPLEPVGIDTNVLLGFHDYGIIENTRTSLNSFDYSLSIPVSIGIDQNKKIVIEPGYKRHFECSTIENGVGDFSDDLDLWAVSVSGHPYIIDRIPIYELFDTLFNDEFISLNSSSQIRRSLYRPELFLRYSKDPGSNIIDLFVPSMVEFSFDKEFDKEEDLFDFRNGIKLSTKNSAINLFGKYGAYPLFDFYTLDEYTVSVLLSITISDENIKAECLVDSLFTFIADKTNTFSIANQLRIENDIYYSLSDRPSLELDWGIYPEGGIKLPIVDEKAQATGFILNKETLSVVFNDWNKPDSIHPVTIIISHSTGLTYPEKGYIRGVVSFGYDLERAGIEFQTEWYSRLMIRGGIEAQFKW